MLLAMLKKEEILQIADLYLKRVNEQAASLGITIELSEAVKALLVEKGYDPNMGARPLRRAVQRFIEDPLSEEMLLGTFVEGDHIIADVAEGEPEKIVFRKDSGSKTKELVGS